MKVRKITWKSKKKGDKNEFVLAYKSLIMQAKALGLITQSVNADNVFGDGTLKATKQVQKKYKLEVDSIAGAKTITALRNAINKELSKKLKAASATTDRNKVLAEVVTAVNKLKV